MKAVVETLETLSEATRFCAAHLSGAPTQEMVRACGQELVGTTVKQADRLLAGPLDDVLRRLGLGNLVPIDSLCLPVLGVPCD